MQTLTQCAGSSSKQEYRFFICHKIRNNCFCGKVDAIDLKERQCFGRVSVIFRNGMASAFPQKQLFLILWQIKKRYSCWLLLILWVPKCNCEWRIMNYELGCFGNIALTKTMQTLTALYTKLLKTVTVKVLEGRKFHKIFYEMANVVKDSGEEQLFLLPAGARKQLKKLS